MHAKHADDSELNELSGRTIGCAFTVLNTLGPGFLEKVYENALAYEVRAASLSAVQQYGAKGRMQCTNHLQATSLQLCLLLDFGKPRLEIKRVAHGL